MLPDHEVIHRVLIWIPYGNMLCGWQGEEVARPVADYLAKLGYVDVIKVCSDCTSMLPYVYMF